MDSIREIEQLEDGSSVYEFGELLEEEINNKNLNKSFYVNLAVDFSEEGLRKLSTFLLEAIEEDIEARKPGRDAIDKAAKLLGFSIEDLDKPPFPFATRTYDNTLLIALLRNFTTIVSELFRSGNITDYKIQGVITPELEKKAEIIKSWFNHFLTTVDVSYRADFEKCILYNIFEGSAYKKVYYDETTKRPKSRFILPENFIVDSDCTSILESERLTHVLSLNKRDILLKQQNNIYRDVELPYLKSPENIDEEDLNNSKRNNGIDLDVYTRRSLYSNYEIHTYLNLSEFHGDSLNNNDKLDNDIPLPYIVTIDKITKEVLAIYKNWGEDKSEDSRIREEYFVQYQYLSGFGIDGLGLAQIMGSDAKTLTMGRRMLVDAGAFSNLPGGIRTKGFKQQQTDIIVGPGQWPEIDTGGTPLKEAFMNLPYPGPSTTLKDLMTEITQQAREAGSVSEMGMLESKEDIPTNTVLAALEIHNRIQSQVFRSIHASFAHELQLLYKIFKKTVVSEKFFTEEGEIEITSEDFLDEIIIVPASDPAVNSSVLRLIRAQEVLKTAITDPALHNMSEVFRMNYKAQGLGDKEIDAILKREPREEEILPVDPVTAAFNILLGKPVKAFLWQNHPAYIMDLGITAQRPEFQDKPEAMSALQALITEHQAYQYLIEMQQLLGYELPPLEEIQDQQVQNAIALGLAQKLEELGASEPQEQGADPKDALLMADIRQKEAATAAQLEIAKLRVEADIFKAQLDFEKEKAKIESNEDIAQLKSETELTKQGVSNEI